MAKFPNIISGSTTGAGAASLINGLGSDVEHAISEVSSLANANEKGYTDLGTIIFTRDTAKYYISGSAGWTEYTNIPTSGSLTTYLNLKQDSSAKGLANGYAGLDSGSNLILGSAGITDSNVTTAIKFGDGSNTSLNTDNKTIVGSLNEIQSALSYLSAGVSGSPATLTDNGNGTATVSTVTVLLYDNPDFLGEIRRFNISGSTFTLTDNSEEYIAVKYNNGSPVMYKETVEANINNSDIIPIFNCWRQGSTIHSMSYDSLGNGLSNKAQHAMYDTELYKVSTGGGLVVSETTSPNPRTITVSGGTVYTGAIPQAVGAFNSFSDKMTLAYHSSGSWLYTDTLVYNNTQYDNGTNLVAIPSSGGGRFGVVWYYRSIGDVKQLFYVLGNTYYDNFTVAETTAMPRIDLNILLKKHCLLIGRSIIQLNATSGVTQSSFGIMFNGVNVPNHNDLSNIQGGVATTEYYHTTATEYAKVQALGTISSQNSNNVNITGGSMVGVSGNLTGNISGSATLNVLKSGDTMSGSLILSASTVDYSMTIAQNGSGSLLRIGDVTNNTVFEKDGTLRFSGSATVYNDIPPVPLINARLGGGNQPSLTVIQGTIQALTFAIGDYVFGSFEILHEYKEGTPIEVHIHWANQTSDASNRGVNWEFEYTIANLNDAIAPPFTNVFPASVTMTKETLIPANSPAKSHIYTDIGNISGTGIKIGSYVLWRLRRIAAVTTPTAPSTNPYAFALGAHIEQDTLGSRSEHSKY